MPFRLVAKDPGTSARLGLLSTRAGEVETPAFMVVGTQGTVKGLTPRDVAEAGAKILLANTYHLALRPGAETVAKLGGLHRMMAWPGPILTDSGGFQVFSLGAQCRITEEGAAFRSHLDGAPFLLTPEIAVRIQTLLDSDILMVLDECLPFPVEEPRVRDSVGRTLRWARRCLDVHPGGGRQLWGIVQGSVYERERARCAAELAAMGFDGYAIGGVSVGEGTEHLRRAVACTAPLLPEGKPRYLMGVGEPRDLVESVAAGVDLFDCVLPTRNGRNAQAFTMDGILRLRNARYREDPAPIEAGCDCYACRHFSRGAICHWFHAEERLAGALTSLHNVRLLMRLMGQIRDAIQAGRFAAYREAFLARYAAGSAESGE